MKYVLLTLAMALIVAVTSCENGKVELPVGDTGADTVDIDETVGIDTTVKDTADTEDASDTEDITTSDTTAEVTTVMESTESKDTSETQDTSADYTDIQTIIDENLDILSSDPYSSKSEQEIIDTYPDNFSAIVSLGKAALPYLEQYASNTDNTATMSDTLRAIIARNAAYSIDPSLYDLIFESPDGKSRIIASVRAFADDHAKNPEITYGKLSLDNTDLYKCNFTDVNVAWSDDSGHAALIGTQKNSRFPMTALLIDTVNETSTELPALEIYNSIVKDYPNEKVFLSISLTECEWISDEQLRIGFNLNTGTTYYPQITSGWYIWDINTQTIAECVYEIKEIDETDTSFSTDEIAAIIDKNLDILINDREDFYSEEEFISAHPEAFAEIVQLGEAALTYLEKISSSEPMNANSMFTGKISKGMAAKIAAYVINPSLYDLVFTSADGEYTLRLGVASFLCMEWGGTITTAYNQADIISCAENRITLAYDAGLGYNGAYSHVSVEWSPDSAYVAVQCSDQKFYSITDIYDVKSPELITLPSIEKSIIPIVLTGSDTSEYNNLDYIEYCVDSWLDNSKVKIKYYFRYGHFQESLGYYIYDLIKHNISYVEHNALNYDTE